MPPLPGSRCHILSRLALLLVLATLLGPRPQAHSPHDVVNQLALAPGANGQLVVFAKLQLTAKSLLGRSFDGGASWSITALPVNERDVSRIALSPDFASDGAALLATTDVGLLLSHDRGDSFTQLIGGALDPRILDAAFSQTYSADSTLYAATPSGMFVSGDDGASWSLSNTGMTETVITRLSVAPDLPGQLFAGRRTLHASADGGASWVPLHTFASDMLALAVSPTFSGDQSLAVVLANGGGVFTSTDGGMSWNSMSAGLSDPAVNDVSLGSDGSVAVVTEAAGCFVGPLGGSFSLFDHGFEAKSNLTTNHYRVVQLDPGWPASHGLWVGGFEGLFASDDGGALFRQKDVYSERYNRQLVFASDYAQSGQIFLVNYGAGLLVTPADPAASSLGGPPGTGSGGGTPSGPSGPGGMAPSQGGSALPGASGMAPVPYATRSDGVLSLFGQALALSPQFADDDTMFYAQSTLWRSNDRGRNWSQLPTPPGVSVIRALAVSPGFPADPTLWLGGGQDGGAFRSPDAGQSWTLMAGGLPAAPGSSVILPSPAYPSDQTLFLSSKTDGVFRSTDGGNNWIHADTGLPAPKVVALAISPGFANDATLFAGLPLLGLFRSTDGGDSWQEVNQGLPTNLPLSVERVAVSPDFPADRTAFVVLLAAGVFKTTDGGDNWTPVGAGLPADAPRVVSLSPDYLHDRTLLVSTYGWTYASHDGGDSFSQLPGYARIDDFNPQLHYEAAGAAALPGGNARAPHLPPGLSAWPVAGVRGGTASSRAAADGAGASLWPGQDWPQGAHGAGVSQGLVAGDLVDFDFFGDRVRWFAPRAPDQGQARVFIDGQPQAVIDLYAPQASASVVVFSQQFDSVGAHRIRVLVSGQANPAASDSVVRSDGFDVSY